MLSGKFQLLNTIAFVAFCIAMGQVLSLYLTALVYGMSTSQVLENMKNPANADRYVLILLSFAYTLISFLFIPVTYLLFQDRDSLKIIWGKAEVRSVTFLLSIVTIFTIMPFISTAIKLNLSIELPIWLSELESYFKESEKNAHQFTSTLLSFSEPKDLTLTILTMALIPGIVEELFFRGIVQVQLQNILKNSHYAILTSALLFSFFHFQFCGFIPRLILGALLGYIFLWTKNIWYPCAAHVTNNLIAILGGYFAGRQFLTNHGELTSILLCILSFAITIMVMFFIRRRDYFKS